MTRDIAGIRKGALVALEFADVQEIGKVRKHRWTFKCDCGSLYVARKDSFLRGGHTSCGCKMTPKVLIGDVFGCWTVLRAETKNSRMGFICVCSCGTKSWMKKSDLTLGKSTKCINCGYKRFENFGAGESAKRKIYSSYKKNASARGFVFELSFEQFSELISKDCVYSGHEPSSVARGHGDSAPILYNGIDRMDNSIGYTVKNSVTCCAVCNRAKRAMPYDEWIQWLETFTSRTLTTR